MTYESLRKFTVAVASLFLGCALRDREPTQTRQRVPSATFARQEPHADTRALPPSPPQPVDHLLREWELPGDWTLADANARYVLARRNVSRSGATELGVIDVTTGRVVTRVAGPDGFAEGIRPPVLADIDRVLAFVTRDRLVGIDAASGRTLWTANHPTFLSITVGEPGSHLVLLYHSGSGSPRPNLLALDTRTGITRWSDTMAFVLDSAPAIHDGRVFVLQHGPKLQARAAETGVVLWTALLGGSPYVFWRVATSHDAVVAVGPANAVVLDPVTGEIRARLALSPEDSTLDANIVGNTLLRTHAAAGTEALALGSGTVRWVQRAALWDLRAGHDAFYGCADGETLVALDADTGAHAWSIGLGRCEEERWPYPQSWFRVARDTPLGDMVVVQAPGALRGYARGATSEPVETAVIAGVATVNRRALAGITVNIGSVVVRTDEHGRFRATVQAREGVTASITREEAQRIAHLPCGSDATAFVRLTGAGRYSVVLEASASEADGCGGCNCD